MKTLLTILILFGDPSGDSLAQGLGKELQRLGGESVQVVVGADAAIRLAEKGVKAVDLSASPNIGEHLTASDGKVIVIQLDRRESAGDIVVDSRIWLDGRSDKHVAIAGNGGDPLQGVISGVVGVISHRLPGDHKTDQTKPGDEVQLATLAQRNEWLDLLGQLAGVKDKSPRQWYYQVLAYSRLGQRDAAVEALNRMRQSHPKHFLIAAAEALLPAMKAEGNLDDGSNTLRDQPKDGDAVDLLDPDPKALTPEANPKPQKEAPPEKR